MTTTLNTQGRLRGERQDAGGLEPKNLVNRIRPGSTQMIHNKWDISNQKWMSHSTSKLVENSLWKSLEQPRTISKDYCYGPVQPGSPPSFALRPLSTVFYEKKIDQIWDFDFAPPRYLRNWSLYFQTKISNLVNFLLNKNHISQGTCASLGVASVAPARSLKTELKIWSETHTCYTYARVWKTRCKRNDLFFPHDRAKLFPRRCRAFSGFHKQIVYLQDWEYCDRYDTWHMEFWGTLSVRLVLVGIPQYLKGRLSYLWYIV